MALLDYTGLTNFWNKIKEVISFKQDKLTGLLGQVVGFDSNGKALATSGFSNVNLLDNWYFLDPIDQRNGYIVDDGVTYYSDAGLTISAGVISSAITAKYVNSNYGTVQINGSTYYVAATDMTRGYASTGYFIDRWFIPATDIIKASVSNHGLVLTSMTSYYGGIDQYIDRDIRAEDILTFSVFYSDVIGEWYIEFVWHKEKENTDKYLSFTRISPESKLTSATVVIPSDYDNKHDKLMAHIACLPSESERKITLKATKLELSDRQTLVYQDTESKWMLNDLSPNKALELAKCQRHQLVIGNISGFRPVGTFYALTQIEGRLEIPITTTMRVTPTVSCGGTMRGEYVKSGANAISSFLMPISNERIIYVENSSSLISIGLRPDDLQKYIPIGCIARCDVSDVFENGYFIIDANI